MTWLAVILEVEAEHAEPLSDALLEVGALAVDIADADAGTDRERALFDERSAAAPGTWDRSRVSALFTPETNLSAKLSETLRAAGLPVATPYRVERVDDRDWVRAAQDQFQPIRISPRLWIVPSWLAAPDPHAVNIVLDPGLAFGTGAHPTTRLCLRWLERHVRGGETVVDFGCGSGILAITALKLGAARAYGLDIDQKALLAARHNAMQNCVEVKFVSAPEEIRDPATLIVANILANPLIVLAPLIAKLTARGGRVALSGVLETQAEEVRAAYLEWFDMDASEHEEGWVMLSGVRS